MSYTSRLVLKPIFVLILVPIDFSDLKTLDFIQNPGKTNYFDFLVMD